MVTIQQQSNVTVKATTDKAAECDEIAIEVMLAMLDEMKTAVAALEETWRVAHAEADGYAAQLNSWKLETRKNGRQAIVEIMDTMASHVNRQSEMERSAMDANVAVNVKQSVMDANLAVNVKKSEMEQSAMDANVAIKVKQSTMDAVAMHVVVPKNSWDTKRKNFRRMQQRKRERQGD